MSTQLESGYTKKNKDVAPALQELTSYWEEEGT